MRKININDITLSEITKNTATALGFRQRVEIARLLDKLKVDVIELPKISDINTDTLLLKTIATALGYSTISVTAGLDTEEIAMIADALKSAKNARINISVPVSAPGMEYQSHLKPNAMLERVEGTVKVAASSLPVEFTAEDALRSEEEFLYSIVKTAISSGASIITLCDSSGTAMPDEISAFIEKMYANVTELKDVVLGFKGSNVLDLAIASQLSAIKAGICEIKTAIGLREFADLRSVAKIFRTCGENIGICSGVDVTKINHIANQISWILDGKSSVKSAEALAGQTGGEIAFSENDSLETIVDAVEKLGYDLSKEDEAKVYDEFKRVAVKKAVGYTELEAIVASTALQVPPAYTVKSYLINSGNIISATANIELEKDGQVFKGISIGDGPVDAAFLAIEQIIGHHYELDDFQIHSVTEGRDSMGSAIVKLRSGGKLYSGQGISTDIIGAAIRGYINALNKIVYEEN